MLDLAWRQWVALGVKGYGEAWRHSPIDPEALILFTCEIGRRDQRLFDAMVEWVEQNGRWINVTRIKRLFRKTEVVPVELLLAVIERGNLSLLPKFKAVKVSAQRSEEAVPLFLNAEDEAMPIGRSEDHVFRAWGYSRGSYHSRGVCGHFPTTGPETILLRLRAFAGLNARAELLTYLLLHREGSPRAIARFCGYGAPTVTQALSEMTESGWVDSHIEGRRVLYSLKDADQWRSLLVGWPDSPPHIDWFAVLPALTKLHYYLGEISKGGVSDRQQASRLRRLLERKTFEGLNQVLPGGRMGGEHLPVGEALLPFFRKQVDGVCEGLLTK